MRNWHGHIDANDWYIAIQSFAGNLLRYKNLNGIIDKSTPIYKIMHYTGILNITNTYIIKINNTIGQILFVWLKRESNLQLAVV